MFSERHTSKHYAAILQGVVHSEQYPTHDGEFGPPPPKKKKLPANCRNAASFFASEVDQLKKRQVSDLNESEVELIGLN